VTAQLLLYFPEGDYLAIFDLNWQNLGGDGWTLYDRSLEYCIEYGWVVIGEV